jgi:hypothetical protein
MCLVILCRSSEESQILRDGAYRGMSFPPLRTPDRDSIGADPGLWSFNTKIARS